MYTNVSTSVSNQDNFIFGWETHAFSRSEQVIISENFLLFLVLLCVSLILQFYIGTKLRLVYLPEAGATMMLCMVVGGIIRLILGHGAFINYLSEQSLTPLVLGFSPNIFYFGFLPPIIFSSGFHLRRKLFFGNLGAIGTLAFAGTIGSTLIIAGGIYFMVHSSHTLFATSDLNIGVMECVSFACVLASTDPISTLAVLSHLRVDPALFYAIFGESVLNDAVAITAFKVSARFVGKQMSVTDAATYTIDFLIVVVGSLVIGYACGIVLAWIFRYTDFQSDRIVPVSVFVCTVYIPFMLSEVLQLSGVVTIFFSGISARRYICKNLSVEARGFAAYVFKLLAHLAETSCFVLLGLSVFLLDFPVERVPFMVWVLLLCIIARAVTVYPLLSLLNLYRFWTMQPTRDRDTSNREVAHSEGSTLQINTDRGPNLLVQPISAANMHVIFFAGLRGAVAFALAYIFPNEEGNRQLVLCTTAFVIVITIIVMGGLTEPLIHLVGVKTGVDKDEYIQEHTARKTTRDFQKKLIYPLVLRPRSQSNASQQQRSSRQFDAEQHDAQLQQQSLQQRQQLQHQLDLGTASMPCTLIEDAAESQVLPAPYHYPLVRGSFVRRAMSTLPPLRTWNRRLAGGASDGHFHLHLVDDTPSSGGGSQIDTDRPHLAVMREDPHPEVEGFDYGQGDDRDGAARGGRAAAVSHLRLAEHSPAADEQRAVRYSFPVQSLASPYIAAGATRRDRSSNAISSSDGNGYSSGAAGCNVTAASRLFSRLDMLMLSESSSDDDEDGDDELEYHSLDLEEQSIASDRSADLKRLP